MPIVTESLKMKNRRYFKLGEERSCSNPLGLIVKHKSFSLTLLGSFRFFFFQKMYLRRVAGEKIKIIHFRKLSKFRR